MLPLLTPLPPPPPPLTLTPPQVELPPLLLPPLPLPPLLPLLLAPPQQQRHARLPLAQFLVPCHSPKGMAHWRTQAGNALNGQSAAATAAAATVADPPASPLGLPLAWRGVAQRVARGAAWRGAARRELPTNWVEAPRLAASKAPSD